MGSKAKQTKEGRRELESIGWVCFEGISAGLGCGLQGNAEKVEAPKQEVKMQDFQHVFQTVFCQLHRRWKGEVPCAEPAPPVLSSVKELCCTLHTAVMTSRFSQPPRP